MDSKVCDVIYTGVLNFLFRKLLTITWKQGRGKQIMISEPEKKQKALTLGGGITQQSTEFLP